MVLPESVRIETETLGKKKILPATDLPKSKGSPFRIFVQMKPNQNPTIRLNLNSLCKIHCCLQILGSNKKGLGMKLFGLVLLGLVFLFGLGWFCLFVSLLY